MRGSGVRVPHSALEFENVRQDTFDAHFFLRITMDNILHIDRPVIKIGERHLDLRLCFDVNEGELCCVTGESGCGKTSLLRAIMGFLMLAGGMVTVCGVEPKPQSVARLRQHTAYVPQELHPPVEWVKEMVALPFSLRLNKHLPLDTNRMFENWEHMGLAPSLYDQRVNELSGGQRSRIALATAMMLDKSLLIADEPTASLDNEWSMKVARTLREYAEENMKAVLVVSHDNIMANEAHRTIKVEKYPTI